MGITWQTVVRWLDKFEIKIVNQIKFEYLHMIPLTCSSVPSSIMGFPNI